MNGEQEMQPSNEHQVEVASEIKPSILKLDVDCLEELFNWLALKDLHSIGQTCKHLHQVAGYVFQSTYPGAQVEYRFGNIYIGDVEINGFFKFIENIKFDEVDENWLNFAKSHVFKSLKRILFQNLTLTNEKIACIKHILNRVETVELTRCTIEAEFYEGFLQYCNNMTKLASSASTLWPGIVSKAVNLKVYRRRPLVGTDNSWLHRKYPKLECFELNGLDWDHEVYDDLDEIFKANPNVRKLLTSEFCLRMG